MLTRRKRLPKRNKHPANSSKRNGSAPFVLVLHTTHKATHMDACGVRALCAGCVLWFSLKKLLEYGANSAYNSRLRLDVDGHTRMRGNSESA